MRLKQYASDVRKDLKYGWWRWQARGTAPEVPERDRPIVDGLIREGCYVTSLAALGIPNSDEILKAGDRVTAELAKLPVPEDEYVLAAAPADIERQAGLIDWGLNERLLAIVSAYIGIDVAYRGLTVRRDIFGGPVDETRMWHRDNEDNRIVKIIVYLNDVEEEDGPFGFLPVDRTPPSWRVPIVNSSRVTEDEMTRLAPREVWRPCTSPRGTAVFVDTCRVYHRGCVAAREDRRTLFYCYNSQHPLNPQWCGPLFDRRTFLASHPSLSAGQHDALRAAY